MSASSIAGTKSIAEIGYFYTNKPSAERIKRLRDYVAPVLVGLGSVGVLAFATSRESRTAKTVTTLIGLAGGVLAFGGIEAANSGDNHTNAPSVTSINDALSANQVEVA